MSESSTAIWVRELGSADDWVRRMVIEEIEDLEGKVAELRRERAALLRQRTEAIAILRNDLYANRVTNALAILEATL